jgi:hypothetical protein
MRSVLRQLLLAGTIQIQTSSGKISIKYATQDTHAGVVMQWDFGMWWKDKYAYGILERLF